VLAHRGEMDRDDEVRQLIHVLGCAYGYVNDVVGHARDLRSGANTYLLASVRAALGDPAASDDAVVRTLATGPWLCDFLDAAIACHEAARPLAHPLGLEGFDVWTDGRVAALTAMLHRMRLLRLRAALDV
jgi:hypothetical protein